MDILIDDVRFASTAQNDLVDILRSIDKQVLLNYMWEHGSLLSKVTRLDRNTDPVIIAGKAGYNYRDTRIVSNQIGVAEITDEPTMKPGVLSADLERYNTEISMTLTYEASQARFIKTITREELLNACLFSIERAILYGTSTAKGLVSNLTPHKKNWTTGAKAPQGSGGYWSAQGIYTMFFEFSEAGYSKKNATFMCGSKAFHQLMIYKVGGAISKPLIDFDSNGNASIIGIPVYEIRGLDPDVIIFGDFRMVFLRMLDLSQSIFRLSSTGGIKLNYNSAFECGVADKKAFFLYKISNTDHDKPA